MQKFSKCLIKNVSLKMRTHLRSAIQVERPQFPPGWPGDITSRVSHLQIIRFFPGLLFIYLFNLDIYVSDLDSSIIWYQINEYVSAVKLLSMCVMPVLPVQAKEECGVFFVVIHYNVV